MDCNLHPARARARWMDEAEHEEAVRAAHDAICWASITAGKIGAPDYDLWKMMHVTATNIARGLK